jgi:hypothetical protein
MVLAREETEQSAPAIVPEGHSRFRRWLVKRVRQLARAVLISVLGLVFLACAAVLWRAAGLIGLFDIGDPFDVAAFRGFRVPEDRDAAVGFRQAETKLRRMPDLPLAVRRLGPGIGWSKADPKLREWVEANRDALALFRRAADLSDAAPHPTSDWGYSSQYLSLGVFAWLALLEGARLEEQGNMENAWDCYRAVQRMRVHVMRRGSVWQRVYADQACTGLPARIASWAGDRRTGVPLLRRALDELVAGEPKPEWDAFSLKVDYSIITNELDRPNGLGQVASVEDENIQLGGERLPPNLVETLHAARRFLRHEPERSRRVVRLTFANWLAHVEDASPQTRKPAVRASFLCFKQPTTLLFYSAYPLAPSSHQGMSPQDLATWLFTISDAKLMLFQWPWPSIRTSEQRNHRALVVLLAEELYRREHGTRPTSEHALVGPYLDHVPDDGSADFDDGRAVTVMDPRLSILQNSP